MRRAFGTMRQQPSGHWVIRWTSPDGSRHCKTIRGTKEQAERELAIMHGTGSRKSDVTFSEYRRIRVRPQFEGLEHMTVRQYEGAWKSVSRYLVRCRVADATPRMCQGVIDRLDGYWRKRDAKVILRKMLNMAVEDGMLDANPCTSVKLPKRAKKPRRLYTPKEVIEVLEAVRGQEFEPLVLVELGGGLRHEEACGLLWEDVAEYKGLAAVRVKRAVITVDGRPLVKGTKNADSERFVLIGEPFGSRLLELRASADKSKPVNASKSGGYRCPKVSTRMWLRFARDHDMVHVTFGKMRGNYATLQGEAFSPDGLVSLAMGHSDGTTKGQHYQQATIDGLERIARNLARHIEEAAKDDGAVAFDEAAIFGS